MKYHAIVWFLASVITYNLESAKASLKSASSRNAQSSQGCKIIKLSVLQQNSRDPWRGLEGDNVNNILGLSWSNVRQDDGTNCGYHALKNLMLVLSHLQRNKKLNDDDSLNRALHTQEELFTDLSLWIPIIYESRAKMLQNALRSIDPRLSLSNKTLLENQSKIKDSTLRSYINSNSGYVKTQQLSDIEEYTLVRSLPEKLAKNILVLSSQYAGIVENLERDPTFNLLDFFAPDSLELKILIRTTKRLDEFKSAQHDILGILWTEPGFGHWVAYAVIKHDAQLTVYELNSTEGAKPSHINVLFKILDCPNGR